ncbi:hypothetical protein NPIL_334821 [Nephila pilipes]|uniref:Uncharacterized protein n=1 Tax=Nephila pilipes TaxID=299642 RepID=A0A8X6TGR5_NEPPI|nr:hypothetical protein NPIL_334821 [Nephila pilipes]
MEINKTTHSGARNKHSFPHNIKRGYCSDVKSKQIGYPSASGTHLSGQETDNHENVMPAANLSRRRGGHWRPLKATVAVIGSLSDYLSGC